MKYPNFNEEKKLWKKGYKAVFGLDEAGRGPLAGPVVAAAVVLKKSKFQSSNFKSSLKSKFQIKDSKKLSKKGREYFYKILTDHKDIEWGIGVVSEKIIDKINILEATKLAMKKALRQAQGKLRENADFLILDGNFELDVKIPQKSIIKGDEKVLSCSLASIFAKVERDRIMGKLHKKYPAFGFNKNKGYGTKLHREMLEKNGPLVIHRMTFAPVSKMLKYYK